MAHVLVQNVAKSQTHNILNVNLLKSLFLQVGTGVFCTVCRKDLWSLMVIIMEENPKTGPANEMAECPWRYKNSSYHHVAGEILSFQPPFVDLKQTVLSGSAPLDMQTQNK